MKTTKIIVRLGLLELLKTLVEAANKYHYYRITPYAKVGLMSFGGAVLIFLCSNFWNLPSIALLPPSDIPEEILRSQIITAARSPIDGKPLTPGEYAQLEEELKKRSAPPKLSPGLRNNIFLLRLRKIINSVFPFIDI